GAGGAVVEPATDTDDADGKPVEHGSVANELVRPQRGEGDDRVTEGDEAGVGQAGRRADHVLLGHTDVEEAIGKALDEGLEGVVAEVAGQEEETRVGGGQLDEGADEGATHARPRSLPGPGGTPRRTWASSAT